MTLAPEPPRRMPARLTLTLLAALAVVLAVAAASLRMHPRARRRVVVALPTAPELREGSAVSYLGVRAGEVERIDLGTGRVVVTLDISRPDVVLRAEDTVRLRTIGLLGDPILDVTPGPRTAPVLGAGDTLVVRATQVVPAAAAAAIDTALGRLRR